MSNAEAYYQTLMVIVLLRYLILFTKTPLPVGIVLLLSSYILSEQIVIREMNMAWALVIVNFICVYWLTSTFVSKPNSSSNK